MPQARLISDGTPHGSFLLDEEGKPVELAYKIVLSIDARDAYNKLTAYCYKAKEDDNSKFPEIEFDDNGEFIIEERTFYNVAFGAEGQPPIEEILQGVTRN